MQRFEQIRGRRSRVPSMHITCRDPGLVHDAATMGMEMRVHHHRAYTALDTAYRLSSYLCNCVSWRTKT